MNVFYVSIRATESYEFDKIRTAGVTENALIIKTARTTIPSVQPDRAVASWGASGARPPYLKSVPPYFTFVPPVAAYIQYYI